VEAVAIAAAVEVEEAATVTRARRPRNTAVVAAVFVGSV
jgi:hypothetical protein